MTRLNEQTVKRQQALVDKYNPILLEIRNKILELQVNSYQNRVEIEKQRQKFENLQAKVYARQVSIDQVRRTLAEKKQAKHRWAY